MSIAIYNICVHLGISGLAGRSDDARSAGIPSANSVTSITARILNAVLVFKLETPRACECLVAKTYGENHMATATSRKRFIEMRSV